VARDLPGLGSSEIAPLIHREFDYAKVKLSPEAYFMMSRVDGKTSFGQLIAIAGVPEGQALTILRHLRQVGAIYLPGEDPKRPPQPEAEFADERVGPVQIDEALLAEDVELTEAQKRIILTKHASLDGGTHFAVLEVPRDADKKKLRAARDRITKDFHPDRALYFKKRLGSYRHLLAQITERAVQAYDLLSDDERREAYLVELQQARQARQVKPAAAGSPPPAATPSAATPPVPANETPAQKKKRAQDLFNAAQIHEASGEVARALREFKEAIALDPQGSMATRVLKRAIEAFLKAQSLRDAEEYAKKLAELQPADAEHYRLYAKVLRAVGKHKEARVALEKAVKLDPGNPHIAAELRAVIEGENG
jgi:tetratricopeptide (TPR) repeat protein